MALQPLLETPLEALLLRYYAAGSSLWTWVAAVLAVALGLWSIRSAAVGCKSDAAVRLDSHAVVVPYGGSRPDSPQRESERRASPAPEGRSTFYSAVDGGDVWSTRKRTVFRLQSWQVDEEEDESVEEAEVPGKEEENPWDGDGGDISGSSVVACWGRGDPGWYRYQDMTALNGRVVRLWEEERRMCGSPLRRKSNELTIRGGTLKYE